ncbi:DNA glycosylase [Syncephalastrum racemosum]|uniref:Endonuclease III homolog n=1 Tax=Syncephalastrum racemosum TaxID=13706 RepID=A0A1X2HDA8_SYNRA|nr:DNA glycosylase [Syncephalastrum racemosum]
MQRRSVRLAESHAGSIVKKRRVTAASSSSSSSSSSSFSSPSPPSSPPPAPKKKPLSKVKKPKVESSPLRSLSSDPPAQWETVYNLIREFRKHTTAPVDTMGCERLAEEGVPDKVFRFQTLISLMLSSQTKDTVTSAAVKILQSELPGGLNLESILAVDEKQLDQYIKSVGFHTKKAHYIKQVAEILRDEHDGDIPDTIQGLVKLPGVGPKMGYLALQIAWKMNAGIGVDVHVHRISNRLGWCTTENRLPEDTRIQLESWLPKEHWREINPMLVGFGQVTCLPRGPKCGECPVRDYCPSAAVTVKKRKTVVKKEVVEDGETKIITVKKEEEEGDTKFLANHEPQLADAVETTKKEPLEW